MRDEVIIFKGQYVRTLCNKEDFKMYAIKVDITQYPELELNQYGNIVICGDLFDLQYGIDYEITVHREPYKYGYKVINLTYERPHDEESVFAFLNEILTYRQAETLFNNYPDIIDRVKENRLDDVDLNKLKGIKEKTFEKIVKKITENYCLVDLVSEFKGYLSLSIIRKLYNEYKSVDKLKYKLSKDAYKCLCEISGIGFKKADGILLEIEKVSKENIAKGEEPIVNFKEDLKTSLQRCKASLVYLLTENEENGHTQMNLADLRTECMDLVSECADKFTEALKDNVFYYNLDNMEVSLRSTYAKEYSICKTIINAIKNENIQWDTDIEQYRTINGCNLSDEQISVLDKIKQYNVVILNGSGGVGKSFSLQSLLVMLKDLKKSYTLLAPTGKASKVISEYTNENAKTIHRGLGYVMGEGFTYNKENKLDYDVIIVDEFSMVDLKLMKSLVDAIDFTRTKLLMIGDNSQLPSVGCGNIFHDLIQSNIIPTATLTKVFRYGEGGLMKVATDVRLCQNYLEPNMKNKATTFGSNGDYTYIDVPDDKITDSIIDIYKSLLSNGKTVNDIQVLSSMNKGEYGTIILNNKLQKVANKNYGSQTKITIQNNNVEISYYIDDLVIQTSNNYKAIVVDEYGNEIFEPTDLTREDPLTAFIANGESGIIKEIYTSFVIIDFDGILVKYDKAQLAEINLGYAINIFKSQGSSSNIIILATPKAHTFMLNSNLIYVGLTRMKKRCFHLGNLNTVKSAIKRKANLSRNTFSQRLLTSMKNGVEVDIPYPKVDNKNNYASI